MLDLLSIAFSLQKAHSFFLRKDEVKMDYMDWKATHDFDVMFFISSLN
jgi:hypothetical protein